MPESSLDPSNCPPRFGRTMDMLGGVGFARLRAARVLVVGLGGVGSHAAVILARAGIGALTLIDFDKVTWSSLNRHAVAGPEDVGALKTEVLRRHLARICPDTSVSIQTLFFHHDTACQVLSDPPDFVVDAIDGLAPKVALLELCARQRTPVVSSMGAATRLDPSLVRVDEIRKTHACALARRVRKKLGKLGITRGITAVYSIEPPLPPLPPDPDEEPMQRGRVRGRLPCLGPLPGIFGYAVANEVLKRLAHGGTDHPRECLDPT